MRGHIIARLTARSAGSELNSADVIFHDQYEGQRS